MRVGGKEAPKTGGFSGLAYLASIADLYTLLILVKNSSTGIDFSGATTGNVLP